MTLLPDAITYQGITIGSQGSDIYFAQGVTGWGQPSYAMPSTPRQAGGEFGGQWSANGQTYTVNAWLDAGDVNDRNVATLMAIRSAMRLRPNPTDEVALAWSGLLWPGEVCAFVRPSRCEPAVDEDAAVSGAVGLDLQWVASDPTVYSYAQQVETIPTGSPVSTSTFEVANAGVLVPWARRAWEFRMTAHGTLVAPKIRVDHEDGTFEQIELSGLTMTSGQVLTIGDDLYPKVNGNIVSGRIRSTTEAGGPARAPRWWRLLHSTGSDGENVVTMTATSGSFSGFCKTRDTY